MAGSAVRFVAKHEGCPYGVADFARTLIVLVVTTLLALFSALAESAEANLKNAALHPESSSQPPLQLRLQATPPAPLALNTLPFATRESAQNATKEPGSQTTLAMTALFGGGMALLVLLATLTALALRTRFHLELTLLVAAAAFAHAAPATVAELLSPGAGQWLHLPPLSGLALTGAFAALATRSLMETRETSPKVDRTLVVCTWLFMGATLLPLVFPTPTTIAM